MDECEDHCDYPHWDDQPTEEQKRADRIACEVTGHKPKRHKGDPNEPKKPRRPASDGLDDQLLYLYPIESLFPEPVNAYDYLACERCGEFISGTRPEWPRTHERGFRDVIDEGTFESGYYGKSRTVKFGVR